MSNFGVIVNMDADDIIGYLVCCHINFMRIRIEEKDKSILYVIREIYFIYYYYTFLEYIITALNKNIKSLTFVTVSVKYCRTLLG